MNEPERIPNGPRPVYRVPKTCDRCGLEWLGNSFHPAPADGSRAPYRCDNCIDADTAARRRLSEPERDNLEPVEPTKPRKVFGYDD